MFKQYFTSLDFGENYATQPQPKDKINLDMRIFPHTNQPISSIKKVRSWLNICAFSGCYKLNSILIPDSVTRIGEATFSGCRSLENVTIGNGVTSIGQYVFGYCCILSLIIPNSVKSIDPSAFLNSGLSEIIFLGTEEEWKAIGYNPQCNVYFLDEQ